MKTKKTAPKARTLDASASKIPPRIYPKPVPKPGKPPSTTPIADPLQPPQNYA